MAEIKPFRGVLYNPEKAGDLKSVMAPPYDVISPGLQEELYRRSRYNIVRLILGKGTGDTDRYAAAASELKDWLSGGVMKRDGRPAIYYYIQRYTLEDGQRRTRKGFIALARLEETGGTIHAHERTLSGPKADRLKLMEACNANFSCIFTLYSDPSLRINRLLDSVTSSERPVVDVTDDDGVRSILYRVVDPAVIERVTGAMKDRSLFIADGHHRYETALNYRNLMRERQGRWTGEEPFNYVMMYFSNMDDTGLTVWPTHRIIHGLKSFDSEAFLREIKKYFDVEAFSFTGKKREEVRGVFVRELKERGRINKKSFGMVIAGKSVFYLLTLRSRESLTEILGDSVPDVYRDLDVTILHELVLARILGIDRGAQERQENITYVKGYKEAFDRIERKSGQILFLMNPTRVEEVRAVAEAGLVMPQKSTYFYPKLLSGLVINLLCPEMEDATGPQPV